MNLMRNQLQISIPTPCHENWQDMTVADKGRFCASCQKNVVDFTQSSDRQIAEVFKKDGDVCGRFLKSQLERELVVPKEKNTLWMVASAAVVAFLGLGNCKVFAQTVKTETVQIEKDKATNSTDSSGGKMVITGTVVDETGIEILGVNVKNLNSKEEIQTDFDGNFTVDAEPRNTLEFTMVGFETQRIAIDSTTDKIKVNMNVYYDIVGDIVIIPKRNFSGRILYRIGNIFRKDNN